MVNLSVLPILLNQLFRFLLGDVIVHPKKKRSILSGSLGFLCNQKSIAFVVGMHIKLGARVYFLGRSDSFVEFFQRVAALLGFKRETVTYSFAVVLGEGNFLNREFIIESFDNEGASKLGRTGRLFSFEIDGKSSVVKDRSYIVRDDKFTTVIGVINLHLLKLLCCCAQFPDSFLKCIVLRLKLGP